MCVRNSTACELAGLGGEVFKKSGPWVLFRNPMVGPSNGGQHLLCPCLMGPVGTKFKKWNCAPIFDSISRRWVNGRLPSHSHGSKLGVRRKTQWVG